MPKVSIVVPVYKVEKYLDRCVQSIQNQTLKDIEIILVNDGSPDNCPAMCDEFALRDPRIKVIHKKNEGLGFARNSGLEIATGEYVTFCDSDDWIDSEAYETIYSICRNENLDLCCFQPRRVRLDGSVINPSLTETKEFIGKQRVREFLLGVIGKDPSKIGSETYGMSSCMALFRRDKFIESKVRFPSERDVASEDLVFLINYIPYLDRIKIVPNVYYNYLINPTSISQNYNDAKHKRLIRLVETVKSFCENHFHEDEYKNHYYSQLLRVFKIILKYISLGNVPFYSKVKHLSDETKHPLLKEFYKSSVIHKYGIGDRLYILAMKRHAGLFFALLYKFRK